MVVLILRAWARAWAPWTPILLSTKQSFRRNLLTMRDWAKAWAP